MDAIDPDQLVTRNQAVMLLRVPDQRILRWHFTGDLPVAGRGDRVCNGRLSNLFRVRDILALEAAFQAKRKAAAEPVEVRSERPLISPHDGECLAARPRLWQENNRKWRWKSVDRRKRAG